MLILDPAKHRGDIQILAQRASGRIDRYYIKNLWTDDGLEYLASRAVDASEAAIGWLAVGTGTVAAAGTDTTLGAEIAGSRVAVSVSGAGSSRLYTAVLAAGVGTGAISEAGLFNAAAAGKMTNRAVFAVKNKEAAEVFTFLWTLSHARA